MDNNKRFPVYETRFLEIEKNETEDYYLDKHYYTKTTYYSDGSLETEIIPAYGLPTPMPTYKTRGF